MPLFELTNALEHVREEFREFARTVLRPYANEADQLGDIPPSLYSRFEMLNAMRAFVPVERGGGWSSQLRTGEVLDVASSEMARVLANEAASYGDTSLWIAMPGPSLAAPIIEALGTAEQQSRFYEAFLGDKPRWAAFAMTEPAAGSDVSSIKTTAHCEGDSWVLNGSKWLIGNGGRADQLVVFANIRPGQGQFGIRGFLVERGIPGLRTKRILPSMGLKPLQLAELIFEDCRIPSENMLGGNRTGWRDNGFHGGIRTFNIFRPCVAAMGVGIGSAAMDYVEEMIQQNGSSHVGAQAWSYARRKVAEMRGKIHACRLLTWKAAWLYDQGKDNSLLAGMAKSFSAQTSMEACLTAMDICNEAGSYPDGDLQRMFRDAKAIDLLEGTGDVQRLNVARGLLASPATADIRRGSPMQVRKAVWQAS
jgi:acyl-CoA dehydrogenase